MKQKRFPDHQIIAILREAETGEQTIAALCRTHGIGQATTQWVPDRWKTKFGAMESSQMYRLKELEHENTRLKRLLAERDLDIDMLREITVKKK